MGVTVETTQEGDRQTYPKPGDSVTMDYTGTLQDGTVGVAQSSHVLYNRSDTEERVPIPRVIFFPRSQRGAAVIFERTQDIRTEPSFRVERGPDNVLRRP